MKKYQVVGIGNAIVDVLAQTEEAFLDDMGIRKGIMQLVERERAETLYDAMRERTEAPGGSVANTLAGLGNLGLSTAFIGRVRDDTLGRFYQKSMALEGTDFPNPPVAGGELPTSRSMIFVTPDGERSMNTYLGISAELGPEDVDDEVAGGAEILFLEGYLFDKPQGKRAFHAAADCGTVVCTRSGLDVVLIREGERVEVPVHRVVPVDATGAGDQFAAGFLYGLATGQGLAKAGQMGCIAAAEVIGHVGARPETDVKALFRRHGLI